MIDTRNRIELLATGVQMFATGASINAPEDTRRFADMWSAEPLDESQIVFNPKPDQEAVLLYTSGTSAFPKGVPISHKAMIHNVEALKKFAGQWMDSKDKGLLILPLFHIFGLSVYMACQALNATSVVIPLASEALKEPGKLLDTIRDEKIAVIPLVPKMMQRALEWQPEAVFPNVKLAILGGDKLSKTQWELFRRAFPNATIMNGYGMTEVSVVTVGTANSYLNVGKPISPHIKIKLVKADPTDTYGEIWISTPSLSGKYLGASKADIAESFVEKGWINTRDLGAYDSDGNLMIMGRSKEIIKRNGEMLSPEAFDNAMKELMPDRVKDVITFAYNPVGLSDKDDKVMAIVIPKKPGETQEALRSLMSEAVSKRSISGLYVPNYILPLSSKAFPANFEAVGKGNRLYKNARAFVNQQVTAGVITFDANKMTILHPDQL